MNLNEHPIEHYTKISELGLLNDMSFTQLCACETNSEDFFFVLIINFLYTFIMDFIINKLKLNH
jgi:hypothetical protein